MLTDGHIQLHRSILLWEWYSDRNTRDLFIHLLLTANWYDEKWQGETIKRGQRVVGRDKLAKEIGLTVQQLRTSLNRLKSTSEITIKTTTKYSVITINNYDTYQADNQRTNQQLTNNQPTTNQQLTTNEESNKAINIPTAANAREAQLQRLCLYFEANNFGLMAHSIMADMADYLDRGVSVELIERCMKEATDSQKATWKYVKSILHRCQVQKVETVQQFNAQKLQQKQTKATGSAGNPFLRDDI
ncbi:DnaD domain protein [Ruminococcaceae bacterium OttesenSCG-928-A16]|nr:DnaD domain protein [Ruminococcaceae bacterium OttesenSCG-928-A16]